MSLEELVQELVRVVGPDFVEATNHPYGCRCDKCKQWWKDMGPDPDDGGYGPFTAEEILGH